MLFIHSLQFLETAGILENSKVKNETYWIKDSLPNLCADNTFENESKLNDSLTSEVKSILEYLDSHHGFSSIKEWYKQNLDSISFIYFFEDFLFFRP